MVHDKVLPRGQRAAFEILNDAASMRGTIEDAGSLIAANDNNNWGFAPGHYNSKCTDCRKWFTGAKRAWRCEPCSVIKAKEYAA
ncbi:hypothetical protein [Agrobacterium rosae]|uniref:hypothetical protein n=1 Tax=Agrobacterium rosae TaxID=1972867 RepID=UPI002033D538|nr:hypothetical protein [Agrobacterium rosae]